MLAAIEACIRTSAAQHAPGAILVEPVQARGGIQIPQPGFLKLLRKLCDELGALLIVDEIYTGFGRTGAWFACEHDGVVPDLICLGKALTGGFPLSACVGRADLMDAAWPETHGEAIHTSTFLGHPVGCAMALAQMAELKSRQLIPRTARLGRWFAAELAALAQRLNHDTHRNRFLARGIGLMAGLEIRESNGAPATGIALDAIKQLLHRGFILLPEGEHANIIGFTPPLTITQADLRRTWRELERTLRTLTVTAP
jgi:4-aminobutyrate aminotransferase-like enzyme